MGAISFSGLASGLDSKSIIQALLEARKVSIKPIEFKIEDNKKENEALDELNGKILSFIDKVNKFQSTSQAIQRTATSSNAEAISVSISGNAQVSSTKITSVTSLARAGSFSFTDRFTSETDPLVPGLAGPADIVIDIGQGDSQETATISIDSTTSLADLAGQINSQLEGSAVASVINMGTEASPQFALLVNGQKTGEQEGLIAVTVSPDIQAQGVFANPPSISQATDAVFFVEGLGEVRRSTNSITGLLPGLTLQLLQETEEDITVNVAVDSDKTGKAVEEMLAAFNELVDYSRENSKIERVEEGERVGNVYGTLARTRIDEQMLERVRGIISSTRTDIEGSRIQTMADIGVSIRGLSSSTSDGSAGGASGTYKFNASDNGTTENPKFSFNRALDEDPAAVQKLLNTVADRLTSAAQSGALLEFTKFNGLIDVAQQSNDRENQGHQERMDRINRSIEAQKATLERVFTNLETTIGRLNQGAAALNSIIGSIGTGR